MSGRISRILDEPEHLVAKAIATLEDKNGYPSHDVRLLAENIQRVRNKISELGLDPDDTTAEELYHALLFRFDRDSKLLDFRCGYPANFDETSIKAAELLSEKLDLPRQWVVKTAAIREILCQHPPKKVMKYLGYRSAQSMIKREKTAEILLAAPYVESQKWIKSYTRLVSKLDHTAFELSELNLLPLSFKKWSAIDGPEPHIAVNNETGTLAIWPSEDMANIPLLSAVILLAESLKSYKDLNILKALRQISPELAWWEDMDYLVADLTSEHVSLNIADNSVNHLYENSFKDRFLDYSRPAFWQRLVSMYDNLPDVDGLFSPVRRQELPKLRLNVPEPVYEFVEDF